MSLRARFSRTHRSIVPLSNRPEGNHDVRLGAVSTITRSVIIDAVVRLLPGALGAEDGAADETFADGLIEYPQYTRPREYRGMAVPDVLLSGDHKKIAKWRLEQRKIRTEKRRPDLWERYLKKSSAQEGTGR